jgi:hypothetical protein
MDSAWLIQTNGEKIYIKVKAEDIKLKNIYKSKFAQLHDEEGNCIDANRLDYESLTLGQVQNLGLKPVSCSHRLASVNKKGNTRKASFNAGLCGQQGHIDKSKLGYRLQPSLVDPTLDIFRKILNKEEDITQEASTLVGALDAMEGLNMDMVDVVMGDMIGYLENSKKLHKFGHQSEEDIERIMNIIHEKVISNTNVFYYSQ